MDKVVVTIRILEDEACSNYDPIRDGKILSTANLINANAVTGGYSVVMPQDYFANISISKLLNSIIQVFQNNLKDTIFDFRLEYIWSEEGILNEEIAKKILDFDIMMTKIREMGSLQIFDYSTTENIDQLKIEYQMSQEDDDDDDDDLFGLYDYIDDDEDDEEEEIEDPFMAMLNNKSGKSRKLKIKSKKKDDYYGRSRIWKNSKNPRKQINRHGVLVSASKNDIKKDEKIIRSFLKDFLPGNNKWKKEFRADVLERWMSMYAISKKRLKQLEKSHRKSSVRKSSSTNKILSFANRMMNTPIDSWSDPRK